jgi:hypothetical protein
MPAQRLTMRRVRELLRLHYGTGASARAIARELGVSRSTVKEYLARAAAADLAWPLPDDLSDAVLDERLFAASGSKPGARRRAEPDWASLAREMKRPGVNLTVLWEEYGAAHPDGYGYSRFCELYRDFERRLSQRCASTTWPATRCSSTIPVRRCRSSTGSPARSAQRSSSSPCSAPRTTPTPR